MPYKELSTAIRKFIAYEIKSMTRSKLDYKGVQDLFTIRNNVFAHAPEQTIHSSTNEEEKTKLQYRKLSSFPHSFIDFGVSHADQLLKEMDDYLIDYTNLMKGSLPDWWVQAYEK